MLRKNICFYLTLLFAYSLNGADAANYEAVTPGSVIGFSDIDENQYIALTIPFGDSTQRCLEGDTANCDICPLLYSVELRQGLKEPKRSRINKIIDNYMRNVIQPHGLHLCKSEKRLVVLQAYVAYYSPEFVSIIFPGEYAWIHAGSKTHTLNIHVPTEKEYVFADAINAAHQQMLMDDLAKSGCVIKLKPDQEFSVFGWHPSMAKQFTIYFDNDLESQKSCPQLKSGETQLYIDRKYITDTALKSLLNH